MSGRPLLREINQRIEELGGEDEAVFDRIAAGVNIAAIAEELGCSRQYLYTWRKEKPHAERRKEKWDAAMKLKAEGYLEDSVQILDDLADRKAPPTTAEVSLASKRSDQRIGLAKMLDREKWDDRPKGVDVNLNIGSLHLEALQASGSMALQEGSEPEMIEADYTEIPDDADAPEDADEDAGAVESGDRAGGGRGA